MPGGSIVGWDVSIACECCFGMTIEVSIVGGVGDNCSPMFEQVEQVEHLGGGIPKGNTRNRPENDSEKDSETTRNDRMEKSCWTDWVS